MAFPAVLDFLAGSVPYRVPKHFLLDTCQITAEPGITITITAPRTTSRDIKRHKASNYQPG